MTSRWHFPRGRLLNAAGEVIADWPAGPAVKRDRRGRRQASADTPEPAAEQDDIDTLGLAPRRLEPGAGKPVRLPRR